MFSYLFDKFFNVIITMFGYHIEGTDRTIACIKALNHAFAMEWV
jgi:hypothetical protein